MQVEEHLVQEEEHQLDNKQSKGFSAFALIAPVFKTLRQLHFLKPTPIQKKALPFMLQGRDVVISSKTGSGKTLAYLLPLFNRVKSHSKIIGTRALVLLPTKQLAMQVASVAKQFIKNTDLKYALLLGGHSFDGQFQKLVSNPDIIVATPGRLMQLLLQTQFSLSRLEYLVIDQADLLFQMGFGDQVNIVLSKASRQRQTILVSATIPEELSIFATSGLKDYVLVKTAIQIPSTLKLNFVICRKQERMPALIYLLKNVIKGSCMIFASTRYLVDLIVAMLSKFEIQANGIYGKMDNQTRKECILNFSRSGGILVVTDVASRGLDIPHIQYVIHYDYPANSKIYLHRSGRTARAGRSGKSYCLLLPNQTPYLCQISHATQKQLRFDGSEEDRSVIHFGKLPDFVCQQYFLQISSLIKEDLQLNKLSQVSEKANQRFLKTRTSANGPAVRQSKQLQISKINILFNSNFKDTETEQFYTRIKNYTPKKSFIELQKEKLLQDDQQEFSDAFLTAVGKIRNIKSKKLKQKKQVKKAKQVQTDAFQQDQSEQVQQEEMLITEQKPSRVNKDYRSRQHFISMERNGPSQFDQQFKINFTDLNTRQQDEFTRKKKAQRVWDKVKKQYVFKRDKQDKLSQDKKGALAYKKWKKRFQVGLQKSGEFEDERVRKGQVLFNQRRKFRHGFKEQRKGKSELKGRSQIINKKISKARKAPPKRPKRKAR